MKITLYTTPDNLESKTSKMFLDKKNINYEEVSLTEDYDAYELVIKKLGYKKAPVIVITNDEGKIVDSWSGFSPINIGKL